MAEQKDSIRHEFLKIKVCAHSATNQAKVVPGRSDPSQGRPNHGSTQLGWRPQTNLPGGSI